MRSCKRPTQSLTGLLVCLLSLAGCTNTEDPIASARGKAVDRTVQALTIGELESANGTYGVDCTNRTGSFSVAIGGSVTLDNDPLSVVLNDTDCALTLTELRTTAGLLSASPAIALSDSYAATPSEFGSPTEFYANAQLDSVTFSGDFVVTVLFSDDPSLATDDRVAEFEVASASASASAVPASNYTLALTGLEIRTDVDDVVQTATGTAMLTASSVTAQRYAVTTDSGLDDYNEIDSAYIGSSDSAVVLAIPAAVFTLVGEDLTGTVKRTLILANTTEGVTSYQVFEITFHPAPLI